MVQLYTAVQKGCFPALVSDLVGEKAIIQKNNRIKYTKETKTKYE